MTTLLGLSMLAMPLAVLTALARLLDRRRARRQAVIARQILLTDALHARLGAAVAPFVRRRGRRWQVAVAVPFERPAVIATVLATVDELFDRAAYEIVLCPLAAPGSRDSRPAPLGTEALSWT